MQRTLVRRGPWAVPSWSAVSVVAGQHLTSEGAGCTPIREDEEESQYLWSGLPLEFFHDEAEAYWYNLTSESPSLFVICHESPDGELTPFFAGGLGGLAAVVGLVFVSYGGLTNVASAAEEINNPSRAIRYLAILR